MIAVGDRTARSPRVMLAGDLPASSGGTTSAARGRMSPTRSSLVVLLVSVACRASEAQVPDDPLGPVRCFEIADARGLASTGALELCAGATSAAPGQCFADATDRGLLTSQQIIRLCREATSNEPLACFERLTDVGTLTNQQIIDYCATKCALGPPPPEAGNAACIATALEQPTITNQMAGELCLRARSVGPVACFVVGERATTLPDSQLVQLCAESRSCQYINVPPPPQ